MFGVLHDWRGKVAEAFPFLNLLRVGKSVSVSL